MKHSFLFSYPLLCIVLIFVFPACKKKDEPIIFSGQLLMSKKYPIALANRKIEIFQAGYPSAIGINSGSTSSSAIGLTNANGNFQLHFTPGTARFIIF